MPTHHLWLKDTPLRWIKQRKKLLEVRAGLRTFRKIAIDDQIIFQSRTNTVRVKVHAVKHYPDLVAMMKVENLDLIAPGVPHGKLFRALKEIVGESESAGILVFDIEPIL